MKILPSDISINMIILMNILNNISLIWNRFWNPVVGFFYRTYLVWELLRTPKIVYPYIGKTFTETFPPEIITLMLSHIKRNQDKCRFLITCQGIMKCDFTFDEEISISKIEKLQWYDKFTKVGVYHGDKWSHTSPAYYKHLIFLPCFDPVTTYYHDKFFFGPPILYLPQSVTLLTIEDDSNMIKKTLISNIVSISEDFILINREFDNVSIRGEKLQTIVITFGKEINPSITIPHGSYGLKLTEILPHLVKKKN